MKKLMIAAAAAAMIGGAFAAKSDDACNEKTDCPFGYQIKIYLKTTKAGTLDYFNAASESCTDSICLRTPAVKRFAGFIYGSTATEEVTCGEDGCCCNDWSNADLVLWNYDTKAEVDLTDAKASILLLDRIYNGDTKTVEMCFDIGDMRHAGFGVAGKLNGKWTLKSAAGFAAGLLPQVCSNCAKTDPCTDECTDMAETSVSVWAMCASESSAPAVEAPKTAAYGKWTIDWSTTVANGVYNANLHDKLTKPGKDWGLATPVEFTLAD